jgi:hypothetical protein
LSIEAFSVKYGKAKPDLAVRNPRTEESRFEKAKSPRGPPLVEVSTEDNVQYSPTADSKMV